MDHSKNENCLQSSKIRIDAFFASRMNLSSLRENIFELGAKIGKAIWIYEYSEKIRSNHQIDDDDIQQICLQKVREDEKSRERLLFPVVEVIGEIDDGHLRLFG